MATATSLTAETIEEMMGGWVQVSVVQETQAALLSTFEAILATNTENLDEFNNVTLPAIQSDLADSAISVTNLTDNQIPALQVQLDGHEENLDQLNDVIIPDLQAGLNSNYEWIANLNDVVLPELYSQLDANNALITEFNDVTLPALQADIAANTAAIEAIDLTGLQTDLDAAEAAINTLNTTTIPGLESDISDNATAINTLNTTTIPGLSTTLGTLNTDLDAVEAKFPITAPDIAANAVIATKIQAGAVVAGKIAADAVTATTIAAGAVIAGKIAADAVTATEIAANAITASELAANSVIAGKINANAVTATTIAAGAVVAGKIAADAVTANEIAANAVTATEIAANAVTATAIAAGSVIAGKIAADAVTATEIAANAITASELAASAVTTAKLAAGSVVASKLMVGDLTNLVPDGQLTDATNANWVESHNRVAGTSTDLPYFEDPVSTALSFTHYHTRQRFAAKASDKFYIQFEVSTPATNTENININPAVLHYKADGTAGWWATTTLDPIAPNTAWVTVSAVVEVWDATTVAAEFDSYFSPISGSSGAVQTIRVRNFVCRRQNAGELTVDGSIKGIKIAANTITADQIDASTITGDLLAGEVIFGGLIRAGDLDDNGIIIGSYSELGARGIYTVDDSGEPVFFAPTDSGEGAYLKAHVDLLSADVKDNFTMHGTNNQIATEAELTLSAGVEAPSVPPVLQQVWDQVQLNKTTAVPPHTPNAGYNLGTFALNPAQITSITWDSTWSNWTVIQQKSNGFRVWRFNGDGSIQNNLATGRPWVDDWNDRQNAFCTYVDDKNGLATIFLQGDQWYIWDPNYINKIPASWIIDAAARPPALYYDTINNQYCLVQNNGGGSGTIHVRRFTVNSGANFPNATSVSTNNFEAGSGLSQRINGAVFGAQLTGSGTNWVINTDTYQTVYTFTSAGVAYDDDGSYRNWLKPGASLGFAHNGTNFVSVDSAGLITAYTNWTWLQSDGYVWVGASAADTDPAGNTANPHVGQAAGTHETPVGTMKAISLYRRSKLRITMPETNDSGGTDDPDKWRLYFKRGSNVAPTDKTLLKLIGDIGSPTASTSITITADATGGNPPGGIKGQGTAINNFPGADPGRIESAGLMAVDSLPILQMLGSGAGRWGTLTVDTNGKAVIGGDTGWINATLTSGWTNYGSPYAPAAYRRIGNVVYLRGLVQGGAFGSANPVLTLPVGFRPTSGGVGTMDLIMSGGVQNRSFPIANLAAKNTGNPDDNTTAGASTGTAHTHGMKNHQHPISAYSIADLAPTNMVSRIDVMADGRVHVATDGGAWASLSSISFLID